MSRLYVEPSHQSDIRIETAGDDSSGVQNYLEKVATLIPGEIIAAYLVMIGFVPGITNDELHWIKWAIVAFCFVLTPIYLNYQAEKGKPKFMHMVLSSIAFIIWAFVTSGNILLGADWDPSIGSIILVAFTLVSGLVPLNR